MNSGSIKIRRTRCGVSIRATGEMADRMLAQLAALTRRMLDRRRLRVRFADQGQAVQMWELDGDGRVIGCGPCNTDLFVGGQVHGIPVPGEQPVYSAPGSNDRHRFAWTVEAVELLPMKDDQ